MATSTYEIRPLAAGDEASLLATFERVFGQARERAAWEWAFHANPAGTRCFVALQGGEVVAQYAALPQRVWMDGAEYTFCQVVDAMVHPDHRAGLKRPGLFVNTGLAFFDTFGGRDADQVFFGWPVEENRRIGERFLGYESAGRQLALVRPAGSGRDDIHSVRVDALEHFDHQAQWLYERCVDGFGASAIRDAAYLEWRYVARPDASYERYAARDEDGSLRGLAIARPKRYEREQLLFVAEWLVPPEEPTVGSALLATLERRAREQKLGGLVVWVPGWSPWFAWLQEQGFRVHPTPYELVVRSFTPRIDAAFLRERWWYQLGDSDFI